MRYYGKAEDAARRILQAFQDGDIPEKMAWVFLSQGDIPCRKWSIANQMMVALMGYSDARGFRQWQDVGRYVKKGETGFPILVPLTKKVKDTDNKGKETESVHLYGFKSAIVFGLEQTDGKPMEYVDRNRQFLESLPLIDVAQKWGIKVQVDPSILARGAAGTYSGKSITLAVGNLLTWVHELIHAADERKQGKLKSGQHWDQEIVAELGGAVLLECLGFSQESNRGRVWEYASAYARKADLELVEACQKLLKRICEAVELVLEEAIRTEKIAA